MMDEINPNRALSFVSFTTLLLPIQDDAAPEELDGSLTQVFPLECDKDYRLRIRDFRPPRYAFRAR